jgi:hypothetical protein
MPAFLTHWRVLIETARRSQDAGSDLGSLIIDTAALNRRIGGLPAPPQTTPAGAVWHTGPLPEIDYRFPGSDISAMAFLGALAPDIAGYQRSTFKARISDRAKRKAGFSPLTGTQAQWSRLLHTNRSGDFLLAFLEQIAQIPSPALRSQALAFSLGYVSHIATDIALNPWINALANAYAREEIPGLARLGRHFYVELCLDEYIASSYFGHAAYTWLNQPWRGYIEPSAHHLTIPTTLAAQTLTLLTTAAEATYGLSEEQSQAFRSDYLVGLRRLRLYLAGQGSFRWLMLNTRQRKHSSNPIIATIAARQSKPGIVTVEEAIAYAIHLSERLCRRAISYYASLRNTRASAEERSQRRMALRNDLRNWDLETGYTLEVSFDQEITLRFLHNWIHFADLWEQEVPASVQIHQTLTEKVSDE